MAGHDAIEHALFRPARMVLAGGFTHGSAGEDLESQNPQPSTEESPVQVVMLALHTSMGRGEIHYLTWDGVNQTLLRRYAWQDLNLRRKV